MLSFIEDALSLVIAGLAFVAPIFILLLLLVTAGLIWRWLRRRRATPFAAR